MGKRIFGTDRGSFVFYAAVIFLTLGLGSVAHAQSVLAGFNLYKNGSAFSCQGCHISDAANPATPPGTGGSVNHRNASNNPAQIGIGLATAGEMLGLFGTNPTAAEQFSLALYIGQYKAPLAANTTITTTINTAGTRNVYALLPTDGSSGVAQDGASGVTATNGANGTTSVSIVGGGTTIAYNITYTPTAGFVGGDTFNYTITNPSGSSTKTVTVTVLGTGGAVITSPLAAAGTANVAFTGQIVATNGPITAYSGTGLPPGITVNPVTGAITGTPTTPGTFNATLQATNGLGLGPPLAVTFTIATPATAGSPVAMTVPLNTPTTVDLAGSIAGFAVTGVSIATAPGIGTATVNGTQVTYTPRNNYFGPDSFTYVAFGAGGTSPPATVSVTVVGRPDPSQDPTVIGTINSQLETARRFSQSQLTNYQRRMESLHRGGGAPGSGPPGANAQASAGNPPAAADNAAARPRPFPDLASANPLGDTQNNARLTPPVRVAGLAPPTDAANPATGAFGTLAPGLMSTLMSAATSRSINLAAVGGGSDTPGATTGSTSFWLGGDARFGTRDPSGGAGSTSFSTDGVSIGADRRFSDKLVLGVGLGFARDKASIGTDGTQSRATGQSGALYGSYQTSQNTYVDALLGYGTVSLDAQRFVAPIGTFATSHRSGNQIFGSVSASYEYRNQNLLVSPYGRLDFTVNKLKQTSEAGAGLYSLTYFDQTDHTSRATLGLRAEASHETDWGVAKPRVRVEYLHGFQGGGSAQLAYADQIGGPNYAVNTNTTDRNSIAVSVGSSLALRNGVNLGIDYQIMRSFAAETSQAVRFTLSKEFDGKGYSGSLLPNFDSTQPPLGIRVDAGYMYDRNVSRGRDSGEKLSDQSYTLELSKGWIFPLSEHTRAVVALSGGAEKFHSYEGLSRLYAGAFAELQYRTSGSFSAPTYALFARATGEQFESYLRDGYRYSLGASVRKPVTDRITLFGAVAHNERNAQSTVFIGRDNSAKINIDYAATSTSTLYLTTEYRKGDATSSGLPSLQSLDIAKVFARDDAFNDQLFAYRIDASTVIATLGYNLPFGPRDALDFSWRHVETTSDDSSIVYGKSRYRTDQLSISYLLRF